MPTQFFSAITILALITGSSGFEICQCTTTTIPTTTDSSPTTFGHLHQWITIVLFLLMFFGIYGWINFILILQCLFTWIEKCIQCVFSIVRLGSKQCRQHRQISPTIIVLLCLIQGSYSCNEIASIQGTDDVCTASADGKTCHLNKVVSINIRPNSQVGCFTISNNVKEVKTIEVRANSIISECNERSHHFTRQMKINHFSSHRCAAIEGSIMLKRQGNKVTTHLTSSSILSVQLHLANYTVHRLVKEDKCEITKTILSGCHSCSSGGQLTVLCKSSHFPQIVSNIECSTFTSFANCSTDGKMSIIPILTNHVNVVENCTSSCGPEKFHFAINGSLSTIPTFNNKLSTGFFHVQELITADTIWTNISEFVSSVWEKMYEYFISLIDNWISSWLCLFIIILLLLCCSRRRCRSRFPGEYRRRYRRAQYRRRFQPNRGGNGLTDFNVEEVLKISDVWFALLPF
ncbi:hypothetical protein L3Y34_012384 [Caenorhabditis briggsae]|uniref:Phlebovirus glycoprotein G2 fusion domain-containing protein n=1 Tax=Caenorhabditis briggsae TaxID=6238 RepID=A0AAE9CWJ1_CAEBR|nr:hypothetical protein L3Y34_012384 [Caenorhabditis briggsae]